ncbi:unnamed protein product [Nippostrongylus brasiliensis]|uniref:C-type lectin domain-containing protein n=1 Tax=Nippostrongylus brasiliensis TaxID=27835 RepID=A0A0N4YAX0_NIPBR|nr:unnamed protein product [Nippostrongylus brasiliensis]
MTKENSATDGAFDDMVWIGLKLPRGASIEQWYWTDGSAYNFRAWGHMQPESPKDRCTQACEKGGIDVTVKRLLKRFTTKWSVLFEDNLLVCSDRVQDPLVKRSSGEEGSQQYRRC